jgi:proline iminopeptidase
MRGQYLDVGHGHRVWWSCEGNPRGVPVVVLHGGPGSGTSPWYVDWFDLETHRVILIDQRNSGRSTPHASTAAVDLGQNTTQDLIADVELLRSALEITMWLVAGASWGTTLALAYAQQHPSRVAGMVLVSTVTTSSAEVEWVTRGMARHFPDQWQSFAGALPASERDGNLAAAYNRLLMSPDPEVHGPAAAAWCEWESTHVATDGRVSADPRFDDEAFRLAFSRIVTHYWSHHAFLPDGQIQSRMQVLAGIPATLLHGERDLSSPVTVAAALHDSWPGSRLVVLAESGYGAPLPAIRQAVDDVTERGLEAAG